MFLVGVYFLISGVIYLVKTCFSNDGITLISVLRDGASGLDLC
jgi:hypothetical protein